MKHISPRIKLHLEFVILITIFIVFFGIGMYLLNGYTVNTLTSVQASPTDQQFRPTIYVPEEDEEGEYKVNEIVTYKIMADTKDKEVTGYQVLAEMHPGLQLLGLTSKIDGIVMDSTVKDGYIIIRGTGSQPVKLSDEPLFEMKIQPTMTGLLGFDFNDQRNENKTQFVNKGEALRVSMDVEGSLLVE